MLGDNLIVPKLGWCTCCHARVSSEANTCPHCGQPNPYGSFIEPELGKIYDGRIVNVMDFGAFVEILPGFEGFLHISCISSTKIKNISDVIKIGQKVTVEVIKIE